MALTKLAARSHNQPFETYSVTRLSDLIRLAEKKQFQEFATIHDESDGADE